MNTPVLLAAMLAALPGATLGQEEGTPVPAPRQDCTEVPRADSAVPARATTGPAPQLGSVAPNTRVPSHTMTPSRRAMAAASARAEKTTNEEKNTRDHCADAAAPHAPESGTRKSTGS